MRIALLFYTFLGIFVATTIVTLLGVVQVIPIEGTHLTMLVGAFLVELAAAVIALFTRTDFFGQETAQRSESLATSLGNTIETFDRLSDEIEAAIEDRPVSENAPPHRYLIRRAGEHDVVVYRRMQVITGDQLNSLPPEVRRHIRTYEQSMEQLEEEWERIKKEQARSQKDPAVRQEQRELIKAMKNDLVGIVDFLGDQGLYIDDHYLHVRHLVSQL